MTRHGLPQELQATQGLGRFDWDVIATWIRSGERVLDLGCGDGQLLAHLKHSHHILGYGIEIDPGRVEAAVRHGINVLQLDLERGLAGFEDNAFDHVIMSLSLQTIRHTEAALFEMLRVGHEVVVSFPNFGFWRHRQAILNGRMPVSRHLPYQWYNSPNVRFFTIADFEALCESHGIAILQRVAFAEGVEVDAREDANFLADMALYRLARPDNSK